MRTPSIRTLAALAYDRGEELDLADPAMLSPAVAEWLEKTTTEGMSVAELSLTDGVQFREIAC
jgi:hypothetical protein